MTGSPFSAKALVEATSHHTTTTVDSNVFPPETNKIAEVGPLRRKRWIVCDGQGHMYGRSLDDPLKTLERLDKLRKKGALTDDEYQQVKARLLDRL